MVTRPFCHFRINTDDDYAIPVIGSRISFVVDDNSARFRDDYARGMTLRLPVQKPLRSRPCVRFPLFARAGASVFLPFHSRLLLSFWISIVFFFSSLARFDFGTSFCAFIDCVFLVLIFSIFFPHLFEIYCPVFAFLLLVISACLLVFCECFPFRERRVRRMGAAESREGRLESDSDEDEGGSESPVGSENSFQSTLDDGTPEPTRRTRTTPPSSVSSKLENSLDLQMESLSLRSTTPAFTPSNGSKLLPVVKLYQHLGVSGCSGGKWVLAEKQAPWEFLREGHDDDEEEEDDDDSDVKWRSATLGKNKDYKDWLLRVGSKVKCRVDDGSGMHFFDGQLRVDFVARGVWAMRFPSQDDYRNFVIDFQNCR